METDNDDHVPSMSSEQWEHTRHTKEFPGSCSHRRPTCVNTALGLTRPEFELTLTARRPRDGHRGLSTRRSHKKKKKVKKNKQQKPTDTQLQYNPFISTFDLSTF